MNTTPPVKRPRRLVGAAVALAVAASLAIGVTSASAGTRGQVILKYSSSQPSAGQPFTIKFFLVKDGVRQPLTNPACLGMTNGRPIPVVTENDGTKASCTWSIPSSHGATFDGMLAFWDENGLEYYAGYDLAIHS
jgi:hypothetical protein